MLENLLCEFACVQYWIVNTQCSFVCCSFTLLYSVFDILCSNMHCAMIVVMKFGVQIILRFLLNFAQELTKFVIGVHSCSSHKRNSTSFSQAYILALKPVTHRPTLSHCFDSRRTIRANSVDHQCELLACLTKRIASCEVQLFVTHSTNMLWSYNHASDNLHHRHFYRTGIPFTVIQICTDHISVGGNAIASIRPFVSTLSSELTVHLELLHASRSWQQLAGDWRSGVRLMRSVRP